MTNPSAQQIIEQLQLLGNPEDAVKALRFFKTAPGDYSHGDQFLGIRMPPLRQLVKTLDPIPLAEIDILLGSPYHEVRMLALLLLVKAYQAKDTDPQRDQQQKTAIFNFYCQNSQSINNWDLVDNSSHQIVGQHLLTRDRQPLYQFAQSANLWQRRIAIVATFALIKHHDLDDTLAIAKLLLADQQDLIHKAVGWMLRELGKRDTQRLQHFLAEHYQQLPRTTLRYAIEKCPQPQRQRWLAGHFD